MLIGWLVVWLFGCLVGWLGVCLVVWLGSYLIGRVVFGCLGGWLTGWLVGWLFGWLVGWLVGYLVGCWDVGCLVDWVVGWLFDWAVGWLGVWVVAWLRGWLFDWFVYWLVDWLADWVVGCLLLIGCWLVYLLLVWLVDWLICCVVDILFCSLFGVWLVGWFVGRLIGLSVNVRRSKRHEQEEDSTMQSFGICCIYKLSHWHSNRISLQKTWMHMLPMISTKCARQARRRSTCYRRILRSCWILAEWLSTSKICSTVTSCWVSKGKDSRLGVCEPLLQMAFVDQHKE